jgi:DNA gyrase/topoisomerase IV subunit B|tara:strand:- start:453 stop:968 length:516 start_codon:yes stop_codon:yes gene_type:complete
MNIDLSKYKLVSPDKIEKENGIKKFYDLQVEDDHTFFISSENGNILTHNCDGNAIAALLINFINKYWPELIEKRMLYKVETPILVAYSKKNKKNKVIFYTQREFSEWESSNNVSLYDIKYKKGLAALIDDEYDDIINKPKLTLIKKDDTSNDSLNIWFGKDSSLRKNELIK